MNFYTRKGPRKKKKKKANFFEWRAGGCFEWLFGFAFAFTVLQLGPKEEKREERECSRKQIQRRSQSCRERQARVQKLFLNFLFLPKKGLFVPGITRVP
jgi:hypothetical protein